MHQPITLPAGWKRVWHPTSGRQGGYATFEGPHGATARSVRDATQKAAVADVPRRVASSTIQRTALSVESAGSDYLEDLVTYENRPSSRPPPSNRSR